MAVLEAASEGAPGGRARAYVLGVSHVSRESCEEAAELIRAVRPDVVVLELCKDRLRLLLDQVAFSSLALAQRLPEPPHLPLVCCSPNAAQAFTKKSL